MTLMKRAHHAYAAVAGWPEEDLETLSACPLCGSPGRKPLYQNLTDRTFFCAPGEWTLHSCLSCGSAYLDPRPSAGSIGMAYRRYYTHSGNSGDVSTGRDNPVERLRVALRNGYLNHRYGYDFRPSLRLGVPLARVFPLRTALADRMVGRLALPRKGARLLDVGCGNGAFLAQMRDMGWNVTGVDPDPTAVDAARRRGLTVQEGTVHDAAFPDDHFDAITLNHVIEHLHDSTGTLRECYRILRPGGVLCVITPNLDAQGHAEFGRDWYGLDAPRHLVLFTAGSLKRTLAEAGFTGEPDLLPSWTTDFMYRASLAVANDRDPFGDPPAIPAGYRWKILKADLRTLLRPGLSEELVMMATKPHIGNT
jgi:2-polyprenyl-3-methyl-5-hydroxy-6-metoxy-1,4-benzoquinol methylase